MRRAALVAWALLASGCGLRLSDPVYAFKDIHADEPSADGRSLVLGTIVVATAGTGDLNSVDFVRLGPGPERAHFGVNRVNMFRVFVRRAMKDGNFVIELGPGLYELQGFTTSGYGQPMTWNARAEARHSSRLLITRPGIYDIGTIYVVRGSSYNSYSMERVPDAPGRREVFARALEGTRWARLKPVAAPADGTQVVTAPSE